MEELRNVKEGLETASVPPSHRSHDAPSHASPKLQSRQHTGLTPRMQPQHRTGAVSLRSLNSSVSSSSPFVSFLSPKEAKNITFHRWEYTDDFGRTQGPFDSVKILKWIQGGFFDRRGSILFKRVGAAEAKPLSQQLPSILAEAYAAMVLRMQCPEPEAETAQGEEEMEVEETRPMDLADQLQDIETALDTKALQGSLGTCDLIVVLMPPKRNKEEKKTQLVSEMLLKKAHAPQRIYRVPVHSAILRLSSPVWLEEITAIEEKQKQKRRYADDPGKIDMMTYTVHCDNPQAVRSIINYIYGDRTSITGGSPVMLVSVYLECMRYKIEKIEKEVLKSLSLPLNIEGLIQLATASEAASCDVILNDCVRVLCDCSFALFSGMKHLQLGPKAMRLLLESDNLQLEEIQIYFAAAAWLHQYILQFSDLADPALIAADVQSIYRNIRFCSLSPQRLMEVREPELDAALLSACFRKFFHTEWRPRVFPWNENSEYELSWHGSLYPCAATRNSRIRSSISSSSSSSRCQWAWLLGAGRLISEAVFATEIIKTQRGKILFGVATEDPHNKSNKLACYFDTETKAFVTASIGSDPLCIAYPTYHSPSFVYWPRGVTSGEIVLLRLSITDTSLHFSLHVLNSTLKATFAMPHKAPVVYPCQILRRPFLQVYPFFLTLDNGDTLGIPELQKDIFDLI